MDLPNWLISIVTSATVSGIVTVALKAYFNARITHHFEVELEKYKSELAIKADAEQGIAHRRLEAYPRIVELIYRTRNMARDLANDISISNLSLAEELGARAKELENSLYQFRIDLERDSLFSE